MKGLHIDSVRKSYGNRILLSDVFLSCNPGETIGLIGRNGSGKSTLLKIIFGTESAENIYVRVDNKVILNFSDTKNLINYLPQDSFLPNVRIKKIIELFLPQNRRSGLLDNNFIKPLLSKKFKVLSGGERRIIEILLLLNSNAKYLLLDEPFNGVSPILRDFILDIINQEKEGKGIIITDHDYKNVMKVSDKIFLLNNAILTEIKDQKQLISYGYLPNDFDFNCIPK